MINAQDSCLTVVDVQGKLAQLMYEKEVLFRNVQILIKSAKLLDIPIMWCQQCPQQLGETIPEIYNLLKGHEPVNKSSFSCWDDSHFKDELKNLNHNKILLCGIEAHICIYQTAKDLLKAGYEVEVIADAVSSRTKENKKIAVDKMATIGAGINSVEMILFELLRTAEHEKFKEIAKLMK